MGFKMESAAKFANGIEKGNSFISFDIKAGYRHFYLHPSIRDFFLFHYNGRYFQRIALPFGWSRSAFWFITLLKPFVHRMREWGCRALGYIDDFLVAPRVGGGAKEEDCEEAAAKITWLMRELGLEKHGSKGVWGKGCKVVGHLGIRWDSEKRLLTVWIGSKPR